MDFRFRETHRQEFKVGDVIHESGYLYLIVYDYLSKMLRLVSLTDGKILPEEYKAIDEIYRDRGDAECLSHAELVIDF